MPALTVEHEVHLTSGTLSLRVERASVPLSTLTDFAVRENPKRGFLFVSRVLGKHIPVAPSVMQASWQQLAKAIGPLTHPHFIGLAETATALGEGVAHAWQALHRGVNVTFQHTSRYLTNHDVLLRFDEPHSHAPAHLVYDPGAVARAARELVLVDDELSTGTTLENLARSWLSLHPHVERVVFVSLTDWCPRREAISAALAKPTSFVSLVRGSYDFATSPAWNVPTLPAVGGNGEDKSALLARRSARLGQRVDIDVRQVLNAEQVRTSDRVLVLGTGEYQFPAARLALALETRGNRVDFGATTRSPILPGFAIQSKLAFADNVGDGMPNFVYNVVPDAYDHILVAYEGACTPDAALLTALGTRARAVRLS
ncbi:phosphoribosyltransferase-like predicted ribonucleoside biosynthesis protein [Deinococcus yavapaiensis KR-236]|uniref:Phosphoribosyltransferase-like predicted ribonucleoside biosynthesis protein n=1 Tax=Deinococcus yavapaiensis KR-236 TaxID=694435 RepID=A0A318S2M6_9DEIO|nr:phosphoribosyltransferase-like predicted ribonucleoside biosynthesis protein [Deinococcus yavapaiensis KR-236]